MDTFAAAGAPQGRATITIHYSPNDNGYSAVQPIIRVAKDQFQKGETKIYLPPTAVLDF